jgi:hypothetical protein
MTITFRSGRLAPHAEETHPRVKLAPALDKAALPSPPPSVNWYSQVPEWPMYGNADWGDCVEAEQGHHEEVFSFYGAGALVEVTEKDVLDAYSAITGFDPNAGDPGSNPTDQGTVIQDAMSFWRKTGIAGHKIAAFTEVNGSDITEVKTALALFGPLSIGVNFPASAMDQINSGRPWDVVTNDGGIQGGHCICLVGYDDEFYYVITWGAVQKMTPAWWTKYVEEAWAPVSSEWISSQTGKDPEGVDLSQLGEQFATLTGQNSPFPGPDPNPQPEPTPTPSPQPPGPSPVPVGPADQSLAVTAHKWLQHRHTGANAVMAKELRAWLAAKCL